MNKQTQLLQNSLPMIGAGLGDKLGVKITVSGDQARTDGNTINIPDFNITSSKVKDAVLGYMSHEAAHIKFKSFDGISRSDCLIPLRKACWNIFEDLRIELKMISSMIGTKKWINQIWINRQSEGKRKPVTADCDPQSILFDYLLFTCRVKYRDQVHLEPYLDSAEEALIETLGWKFLIKLDKVLLGLTSLQSSVDAMNLAKEVELLVLNYKPEDDSDDDSSQGDSGGENSQGDSDDDSSQGDSGGESSQGDSGGESSQGDSDGESSQGDSGGESSQGDSDGESSQGDSGELTKSATYATKYANDPDMPTDLEIAQAISQIASATNDDFPDEMSDFADQMVLLAQGNADQCYVSMPEALKLNGHQDLSAGKNLMSSVKATSNAISGRLLGLVQDEMKTKSRKSFSGLKIDNRNLHKPSVGEGRIFKTTTKRKDIDTIVEIAIDNSASMNGHLIETAKEAHLALSCALDKINGVEVTASAFPYMGTENVIELKKQHDSITALSSQLAKLCADGSSTPSASAMMHCLKTVIQSKKQKKVVIFITDGYPNYQQRDKLKKLVSTAEKSGITVLGVAIGHIADEKNTFYNYFSNALFITDSRDLKVELFRVAKDLIIN